MINPCRKGTFSERLFDLMIEAKKMGERSPVEIDSCDGTLKYSVAVNKLAARYCPADYFAAENKNGKISIVYYGQKTLIKPQRNTAKFHIHKLMEIACSNPSGETYVNEPMSRNNKKYSKSSIITAIKSLSAHFPSKEFYTRTCQQTGLLIIGCREKSDVKAILSELNN